MSDVKIGFIGAGNMAQAIFGGLIKTGTAAQNIYIYEPNAELSAALVNTHGLQAAQSGAALFTHCDVVLLAVKPQIMKSVLSSLQQQFSENEAANKSKALIVSIAAGVPIRVMQKWLGATKAIVRVMPNTPALVGAGISGLFASAEVSEAQKQSAESILRAVGSVVWVKDEAMIDVVTAVSGSGPAYFFYLIEALECAAIEQGLDAETARILSLETAFGAAKLALESEVDAANLRKRVTSPGGTTEAALALMVSEQWADIAKRAVNAAVLRSRELANLADQ